MDRKRKLEDGGEDDPTQFISSVSGSDFKDLNGYGLQEVTKEKKPLEIAPPKPQTIEIDSKYRKFINQDSKETAKTEDEVAAQQLEREARSFGKKGEEEEEDGANGKRIQVEGDVSLPLLIKFRNPKLDDIEDEGEKLKVDIEGRPEVSTLEEYDALPVENFGAAYLGGLGWSKGAPIGKTNAAVFKPVEFKRRNAPGQRTGMGAQISEDFVPPGGKMTHRQREEKEKKEKKEKERFAPGVRVEITGGKHSGLKARIVSVEGTDVNLKLHSSSENVRTSLKNIIPLDEKPSSNREENRSSESNNNNNRSSSNNNDNSRSSSKSSSKSSSSNGSSKPSSSSQQTWLNSGLVVRIVSKDFKEGAYYLKKAIIMEVLSSRECTVQLLENSKRTLDVTRSMLETVIPKADEKVMIVGGEDYGSLGTYKQKNKYKDKSVAVVQLADELEFREYDLDHVCQYNSRH
eukprot:TRINITY_DN3725_c0_g1_i1.p1 TRINITY_DN3725_c0_g1~~TRINITY_DN3725_c0_g1_i1.p1  ORF type:complete len:460 (+),score=196.89 TRINITY_DN3725_c0_g1_i1:152-1531(+)